MIKIYVCSDRATLPFSFVPHNNIIPSRLLYPVCIL